MCTENPDTCQVGSEDCPLKMGRGEFEKYVNELMNVLQTNPNEHIPSCMLRIILEARSGNHAEQWNNMQRG